MLKRQKSITQQQVMTPTMVVVHVAILWFIALGSVISCTPAQPAEGFPTGTLPTRPIETPSPIPVETQQSTPPAIPFWTIAQEAPLGDHPARPFYTVVTHPSEWGELHGQLPPAAIEAGLRAGPAQDHLIVVGFAGVKPTSGYSLTVDGLVAEVGRIIVTIARQAPDPDAVREPAMTLPYHLVAIPTEALGPARSLTFEFRDQAGLILQQKDVVLP